MKYLIYCLLTLPVLIGNYCKAQEDAKFLLDAEEIIVDTESGNITALTEVKALVKESNVRIISDKLEYIKKDNSYLFTGNTEILLADSSHVKADSGILVNLDEKTFQADDVNIALAGGNFVSAKKWTKVNEDIEEIEYITFSACEIKECGKPDWQVRATKAKIDRDKKRIFFYNAFVDMGEATVVYTPYISFPFAEVKRATGFLTPTLGFDGFSYYAYAPYFWEINKKNDITLYPFVAFSEAPALGIEYRNASKISDFYISGFLSPHTNRKNDTYELGLFAKTSLKVRLNKQWLMDSQYHYYNNRQITQSYSAFGFDQEFLQDYFSIIAKYPNITFETSFAQNKDLSPSYFEKQRTYAPKIKFSGHWLDGKQGSYDLIIDAQSLRVEDKITSYRLSLDFNASWQHRFAIGLVQDHSLKIKGRLRGETINKTSISKLTYSWSGEYALRNSFPLYFTSDKAKVDSIINPFVSFALANPASWSGQIFNLDSTYLGENETSIQNLDRFSANDLSENGIRAGYGVSFDFLSHDNYFSSKTFIGNSWSKFSELNGELYAKNAFNKIIPKDGFQPLAISQKIRLGQFTAKGRLEWDLTRDDITTPDFILGEVNASNLGPFSITSGMLYQKETDKRVHSWVMDNSLAVALSDNITAETKINWDLKERSIASAGLKLQYISDCLRVQSYANIKILPVNSFDIGFSLELLGNPF